MMKHCFRALILVFTVSIANASGVQPSWQMELAKDWVSFEGGKMVIEQFEVCSRGEISTQTRIRSETLKGGIISRDNFVALTAGLIAAAHQQTPAAKCKSINQPIGPVDHEVTIYMTDHGMKIESYDRNTSARESNTLVWSDMYPD